MAKKKAKKRSKKPAARRNGAPKTDRTRPVTDALKRLLKAVQPLEAPYRAECEPVGYTIRFDRTKSPGTNCRILKLYCCRCDPGQKCDDCKMKDGGDGKLIDMLVTELKI